ncbi:MAG: ADP-ribosylglycohydrolase family protein [Saprospiraceae bacterium]|nr:ADP-ribosylglycohydrolase family protein [Saprospiraceae bacterium]
MSKYCSLLLVLISLLACQSQPSDGTGQTADAPSGVQDPQLEYATYAPKPTDLVISRTEYANQLYGFWLGQCIANWTGLITEMDKIGGEGKNGKAAGFYTSADWGQADQPNMWDNSFNDTLSATITFLYEDEDGIWGADDDTDIEYIYQFITYQNQTTKLTPEQIRAGWLTHIYKEGESPFIGADGKKGENYLWVSNQTAHDLMQTGMLPPATSAPENNPNYEMIDAQLTTEIFGFFAPSRPDIALEIAETPIQTTARFNAQWAAEFYVIMYALASVPKEGMSIKDKLTWMAETARQRLPNGSYSAKMYDFIKEQYAAGVPWETARDALHEKYQVQQADGYEWSTKDQVCNGCFAAGINFGASIVSLLYGEGDIKETIKIGALAGWDSDNPTATWGGLLGFMLGKQGLEEAFGQRFSNTFNIHRTRGGFPNDGIDTFENMAQMGLFIIDRMVQEKMKGGIDLDKDVWYIPQDRWIIPAGT